LAKASGGSKAVACFAKQKSARVYGSHEQTETNTAQTLRLENAGQSI
jgi:hypothetical protein